MLSHGSDSRSLVERLVITGYSDGFEVDLLMATPAGNQVIRSISKSKDSSRHVTVRSSEYQKHHL